MNIILKKRKTETLVIFLFVIVLVILSSVSVFPPVLLIPLFCVSYLLSSFSSSIPSEKNLVNNHLKRKVIFDFDTKILRTPDIKQQRSHAHKFSYFLLLISLIFYASILIWWNEFSKYWESWKIMKRKNLTLSYGDTGPM